MMMTDFSLEKNEGQEKQNKINTRQMSRIFKMMKESN